jgi:hypothetical protein
MPHAAPRRTEKSSSISCSPLRLAMDCKMSPRFSFGRSAYRFSNGSSRLPFSARWKNHLGTRDHHFVAFPSHLLDQDRDLHFAARINLKYAGRFCVVDLEGNIAARSWISGSRTCRAVTNFPSRRATI